MTQIATARRTSKITAAYTAIHMPHIANASPDSIVHCQAKQDMKIEGVNGASVELKAGEWFYLAASESLGQDWYYIVREVSGAKKCSCPARKPCKHEIKVAAKRQAVEVVPVVAQRIDHDVALAAQIDAESFEVPVVGVPTNAMEVAMMNAEEYAALPREAKLASWVIEAEKTAEQSVAEVVEAAMVVGDAVEVVPDVAGVTRPYTADEYKVLHQRNQEWQREQKARDREVLAEAAMMASPLNGNTGYTLFRR